MGDRNIPQFVNEKKNYLHQAKLFFKHLFSNYLEKNSQGLHYLESNIFPQIGEFYANLKSNPTYLSIFLSVLYLLFLNKV